MSAPTAPETYRMTDPKFKRVFTTGQVAKICRVAPRTVANWIDSLALPSYRIPLSKDRRVTKEALLNFMFHHGLPTDIFDAEDRRSLLLIGANEESPLYASLCRALPECEFRVDAAPYTFLAGRLLAMLTYRDVVLDTSLGRPEATWILGWLRECYHKKTRAIAIIGEDDAQPDVWRDLGAGEVFRRPFDTALLVERIRRGGVKSGQKEANRERF